MRIALLLALVATADAAPPTPSTDWSWITLKDVVTKVMPLGTGDRALRVRFGGSWPILEGACDRPCIANKLAPSTVIAIWRATDIREFTVGQVAALADAATLDGPMRRAMDHMVRSGLDERGVWVAGKSVSATIPAELLAAKLAPVDAHRAQLVAAVTKKFVAGADHATAIAELGASPEDAAAVRVLAETAGDRFGGGAVAVVPLHAGFLVRTSQPAPQAGCHEGEHGGHRVAVVIGATVTILEDEMPEGGGCRDPVGPRRR